MTTERDEGMQLGKILAQGDEHSRVLAAMFGQVDKLRSELSETAGVAKEALRLATETNIQITTNIAPHVDDYKNLKAKGLGVLGFIALLGGGVATVGTTVVRMIWPGHP